LFSDINIENFKDPNFKEDSVREIIITPILSKLGYLPSGKSKVIRSKTLKNQFIRVGTRNHPVTTIPDYTLLHDEKVIFILDAKGPNQNILDVSHVQQAYSYAIHPEIRCHEFGLCNGKQLAIFNTDRDDPVLLLDFEEFESKWSEIEKHLLPKYLLQPILRKFSQDFGLKLVRLGITKDIDLTMLGVRLNLFGKVNDQLITASAVTVFDDIPHCVSFDFPANMLDEVVSGLPEPIADLFCKALNTAPFQAAAGLAIELDITVKLGDFTQSHDEEFIPLQISKIHASRFNPSLVGTDPNDIPDYVFQLRKAFKID